MGRPTKEQQAAKAAAMAAAGAGEAQAGEVQEQAGEALQEGEKPAERPAGGCFIESSRCCSFFGSDGKIALQIQRGKRPIEGAELEFARERCPELLIDG